MREVKWVIFDEIHYMRDRERGVGASAASAERISCWWPLVADGLVADGAMFARVLRALLNLTHDLCS